MGRFNADGDYLTGIAGGPLAITPRGGKIQQIGKGYGRWLNEFTVAANNDGPKGEGLYFLSLQHAPILVDTRGASQIAAGGNIVLATLSFGGGKFETYSPSVVPPECLQNRAFDGYEDETIVMASPDYSQFVVMWPDKTIEQFAASEHTRWDCVRAIEGGFVFCVESEGLQLWIQLRGQAARRIDTWDTPYEPYSLVANSIRYFLYHGDRGIFLHAEGASVGHLWPPGFHPDVWPNGADSLLGWATDEESLGGVRITPFDLNSGKVDLKPTFDPPVIAPFGRKIGVLPFFVNHPRYGTERVTPAHGQILNDGADYPRDVPCHIDKSPVIADPTCSDSVPDGVLYGIFSDSRFGVLSDRNVARARKRPLVLYHDGPDYPLVVEAYLDDRDVACIQAYLHEGETPWQAARRIQDIVTIIHSRHPRIALAWMSYAPAPFALADVLALQPLLVEIVRANPAVMLILPFAWARPDGCVPSEPVVGQSHPELAAWVRALVAASDGLPDLMGVNQPIPPEKPPIPPVVTLPTPEPTPPFLEGVTMPELRDGDKVAAIYGGFYARLDPSEPDHIHFDRLTAGADETIIVTKPDDNFTLTFQRGDRIITFLGAPDVPIGSYVRQFETRPTNARGPSESPTIIEMSRDGMIVAMVRYVKDGLHFMSSPLTLVKL